MKNIVLLACLLLFAVLGPSQAEQLEIGGFVLDNPLGPTEVEKIGLNAWGCTWPAGVPYKEAQVELIVATFPADAAREITEAGDSVTEVALTTYLGLSGEPEQINKTLFMKGTEARRVYHSSIPRDHETHVFTKRLDDDSFVMVGVRYFVPPTGTNGGLLQAIANTFAVK